MPDVRPARLLALLAFAALVLVPPVAADSAVERLVAAQLGDTPLAADLHELTDTIGGRPTGSEANRRSVAWALAKLRAAGVEARAEAFEMPALWLENGASIEIRGNDVRFAPRVAAMPFSTPTADGGLEAPLVDAGFGGEADFERLGESAKGAIVLVETPELLDIPGLFAEYTEAAFIESRAIAAGVAGLVYQGSRPGNQLYRHNASRGPANELPMAVIERDGGSRALRLLRDGHALTARIDLDLEVGGAYESHNVVGEIPGSDLADEFVVVGAHLDSWGLGDGALDNGCNVAALIDIARNIRRLGIVPRRTIRFVLWNGEEQGLTGSFGYTLSHADELDRHVMASSYDIGSGRIDGFFTGGRPEVVPVVEAALAPVAGLGPFAMVDIPIVGTDNYDFMMQGIGNLVASQESANYGPNYHARSDTFDKVDLEQVRLNSAITAAVTWHFANAEIPYRRQSRAEVQALIDSTDLGDQMRTFGLWDSWTSGERGRGE